MRRPPGDDDEFAELHALEYRLEELLVSCRGLAIGMNDDLTVEVWGNIDEAGARELVRLATGPDLREAVRQAYLAMQAITLLTVTSKVILEP